MMVPYCILDVRDGRRGKPKSLGTKPLPMHDTTKYRPLSAEVAVGLTAKQFPLNKQFGRHLFAHQLAITTASHLSYSENERLHNKHKAVPCWCHCLGVAWEALILIPLFEQ